MAAETINAALILCGGGILFAAIAAVADGIEWALKKEKVARGVTSTQSDRPKNKNHVYSICGKGEKVNGNAV